MNVDKNSILDELNWYADDFPIDEGKKRKNRDSSPKSRRSPCRRKKHSHRRDHSPRHRKRSPRRDLSPKVRPTSKDDRRLRHDSQSSRIIKTGTTIGMKIEVTPSVSKTATVKGGNSSGSSNTIQIPEVVAELGKCSTVLSSSPIASSLATTTIPTLPSHKNSSDKVDLPIREPVADRGRNTRISLLTEKWNLLEERDKLLRNSGDERREKGALVGFCPDMCPEKERIMRQLKNLVHPFECCDGVNMDENLAVKEYSRSSADQGQPLPHELRPQPVLSMTMSYLILNIMSKIDEEDFKDSYQDWYDFCWDRLRAVRKDIVQQQLCDLDTVAIVEQCARFHIACFDRMWGLDISAFDVKINTENLMNCLKILMNMYEDLSKQSIFCPNEPEFSAYMILIKMNSGDLLWEFLNLPSHIQGTPQIIEAVKIHTYYNINAYSQYFKQVTKTTYLNAVLMQRFFTQLRINGLFSIVTAYSPPGKVSKVSVDHVMKSLKFDCREDTIKFCRSCGISSSDKVDFRVSRNKFLRPETVYKVSRPSSLVTKKRITVAEAVSGSSGLPTLVEHEIHSSFVPGSKVEITSAASDASDQEEKMLRDVIVRKMAKPKQILKLKLKEEAEVDNVKGNDDLDKNVLSEVGNRLSPLMPKISPNKSTIISPPAERKPVSPQKPSNTIPWWPIQSFAVPEHSGEQKQLPSPQKTPELIKRKSSISKPTSFSFMPPQVTSNEFINVNKAFFETLSESEEEEQEEMIKVVNKDSIKRESLEPTFVGIPEEDSNESEEFEEVPDETEQVYSDEDFIVETEDNELKNEGKGRLSPDEGSTSTRSEESQWAKQLSSAEQTMMSRLRGIVQDKLRIISAKRIGRLWRDKVKWFKNAQSFAPTFRHLDINEYFSWWGRPGLRTYRVMDRIASNRKLATRVDFVLNFDVFSTCKPGLKLVLHSLVQTLLKTSPVAYIKPGYNCYWRLGIIVPQFQSQPITDKVAAWFFKALQLDSNGVTSHTASSGSLVHIKVDLIEGTSHVSDLATCVSALIIINVPGSETVTKESRNEASALVPLLHADLGPQLPIRPPPAPIYFSQAQLTSSNSLTSSLIDLAGHSKVVIKRAAGLTKLFSSTTDSFFDAVYEDSFTNNELYSKLKDPSYLVQLFNSYVCRFKAYLLQNYKNKDVSLVCDILYSADRTKGDADAIKATIFSNIESYVLPDLEWPPVSSRHLLQILQSYVKSTPYILSTIIRMVNPPDDDDDSCSLLTYLSGIPWIRVIEIIIREKINSIPCNTKVVYSDHLNDTIISSHWWLNTKNCSL